MSSDYMTAGELITELGWLHPDCPVEFSPITDAWLGTSGPMRVPTDERGRASIYDQRGELPKAGTDVKDCRAVIQLFEDRTNE